MGGGQPPNLALPLAGGRLLTVPVWGLAPICAGPISCHLAHPMPLRVLIVDDNASFRNEMRGLLADQGIEVMPGAASGVDALRQVAEEQPDVVLIDIDLRGESGFDLARRVRDGAGSAAPHMILISTHDERDYADLI